ncbi:glycosyltransferase family 2 protein [Litchfieldia salsa]|uniref:glycosyltransferase family 2 protein n=1 Tax=Litchfieldia salsa TaxID=930152 RepID=UPI00158772E8|nr:glycosyltransferase family 2 protein [Litchfieldia salsa]
MEDKDVYSIVVVNWNGEKYLNSFLLSLTKQSYKDFILYFVDNGSVDRSIEIVNTYSERLQIKVIYLKENVGFASANNVGIEEAMKDDSRYIITLNNDTELDEDCLYHLSETINKSNNEYIYQLLMINFYDRSEIDAVGIKFNEDFLANQMFYKENISKLKNDIEIDGVCAGAAAYPKSALIATKENNHYFDQNFFAYYEDVDLALRLKRLGYSSVLVKDSIVYHVHSGTSKKDSPFKAYYLSRNIRLYLYKNIPKQDYQRKILYYNYLSVRRTGRFLIKGEIMNFIASIRGVYDFLNLRKYY